MATLEGGRCEAERGLSNVAPWLLARHEDAQAGYRPRSDFGRPQVECVHPTSIGGLERADGEDDVKAARAVCHLPLLRVGVVPRVVADSPCRARVEDSRDRSPRGV